MKKRIIRLRLVPKLVMEVRICYDEVELVVSDWPLMFSRHKLVEMPRAINLTDRVMNANSIPPDYLTSPRLLNFPVCEHLK